MKTKDIVKTALCTAVLVISSWICIPTAVPFTLQTMGVFLALSVLGGKKGTVSILIYILCGIIGLPVFSGFRGGLSVISGPTGGYITGFIIIGLVLCIAEKFPYKKIVVPALITGLLFCYLFGTLWFMLISKNNCSLLSALYICVVPFIIPDIIKLFAARFIYKNLSRIINTNAI